MDLMDVFVKIGADISGLESGIEKSKGLIGGIGGAVGAGMKAVGTAVAGATAAVGAFAASSVNVGMSFDSSMAQVAATMGVTVDEIGDLRDFAQDMGAKTAFSATQAADALNYMALAGYDADQSMQMLPNVLNLAAAGDMELARASDMVTDAQSALGLSAEETTQMVDMMAKASSKSNTSVEQLGDAILTVGGTAKTLAGGTTELNTALGILADNGIKGSEGGTKLRNVILSLSSPTDNAAAALADLGVQTVDAEGNLRPLEQIMGELGTAMDGLGTAERAEIISTIFNKTDIAGVNALIDTSADRWHELSAAIDDSAGAADKMANTQLDNLEGDITLFKSALEGAQILVSDKLTPSLREFVQFGTDGLTKVSDAFKEGGISGAMEAFGGVLSDGLTMITEKIPSFVEAGLKLLEAVGKGLIDNAPKIFDAIVEIGNMVMEKGADIMQKLAEGMKEFDFAEAASEIVGIIVEFLTGDSASQMLTAGIEIIGSLIQGLIDALPELVTGAAEIVTAIGEGISTGLPTLAEKAMEILTGFSEGLSENLSTLIDAGLNILMSIADGIITALPILIQNIPTIITNIVKALSENAPKLIEGGGILIAKLVVGIVQAIPALIAAIPQLLSAILTAWKNLNFLEMGKHLITGIIKGLTSFAPQFVAKVKETAQKAVTTFKNIDWKELGINLIKTIVKGIISLVTLVPKTLVDVGKKAIDAFKKVDWLSLGKNIIDGVVKGVGDTASKLIDAMVNLAKNAWSAVKKFFGIESPSKLMRNTVGVQIGKGMALGIEASASDVQDAMADLTDIVETPDVNATVDINRIGNGFQNSDSVLAAMESEQSESRNLTVILELDKTQLAKAVYELNNNETQRVGMKLAGGFA